jgi:hypothetical protein
MRAGGCDSQACQEDSVEVRDADLDPNIFVTTKVNYCDRPAGCIEIAAVWEMAERFGKGREEATWFLKNQTYVDDATGGANNKETAEQVSADMEDKIGNGGFRADPVNVYVCCVFLLHDHV